MRERNQLSEERRDRGGVNRHGPGGEQRERSMALTQREQHYDACDRKASMVPRRIFF